MLLFIGNMLAVSLCVMGAVILIMLRDRTETQLLLAGIALEALVALASLMWIEPGTLEQHYLAFRTVGRSIEAVAMWYVITSQVKAIQRAALTPTMTEVVTKKIDALEQKVSEIETKHEENGHAPTH